MFYVPIAQFFFVWREWVTSVPVYVDALLSSVQTAAEGGCAYVGSSSGSEI